MGSSTGVSLLALRGSASESLWLVGGCGGIATFLAILLGRPSGGTKEGKRIPFLRREAGLRALSRALPDQLLVLDEEGRILELQGGGSTFLGVPLEEILGRSVRESLPPDHAALFLATLRLALRTHAVQTADYARDNQWWEARVVELDARVEGRRCVLWVSQDITERRLQEEALRRGQKLESLGVLASGIAHGVNNLLTTMLSNLSLARVHLPSEGEASSYLERTASAVERASELTRQLLDYARRRPAAFHPLDLNEVVRRMVDLLRVSVSKKVDLELRLEEPLPPVLGDMAQFQQVVMNLVTNASEAIGDRIGRVVLATSFRDLDADFLAGPMAGQGLSPGSYVVLDVSDTGCGMEAAALSHLFEPFYTTKAEGRGLGLSTLLGTLRIHHGGYWITSEIGRGTRFRLFFPALDPFPMEDLSHEVLLPGAEPLQGTLLLVEDEAQVRGAVRELLMHCGLEVVEAGDGLEALEILHGRERHFDAVLLDLSMPHLDGLQTFQAIRDRDPWIPVILCSGHHLEDWPDSIPGRPPSAFLQKPYHLQELREVLRRVLELRPAQTGPDGPSCG